MSTIFVSCAYCQKPVPIDQTEPYWVTGVLLPVDLTWTWEDTYTQVCKDCEPDFDPNLKKAAVELVRNKQRDIFNKAKLL